jgi:hypothetical protein
MRISEKYRHIGYSSTGVPFGWVPLVERAIVDIERAMWPKYMPLFLKRWIHYLATGNSVVRVKYRWAYKLRTWLTRGQIIHDIKDKYAGLRIYGSTGEEIYAVIEKVTEECDKTCEKCGSQEEVEVVGKGWIYNLCKKCQDEKGIN